jgi:diphthamide synthase subunit DPH2
MVSTKNGQHNMNLGEVLKQKIESKGIEAQILVANTFDFESLATCWSSTRSSTPHAQG